MLRIIFTRLLAALPNLVGVVVITFILIFFANFVMTSLYFALVPQKF